MKPCFLSMYRLNRFGGILFMKVIDEPAASCRRRRAAPRPSRDRTQQFVPLSQGLRGVSVGSGRFRERGRGGGPHARRAVMREGERDSSRTHAAARGRRSFCNTRHRETIYVVALRCGAPRSSSPDADPCCCARSSLLLQHTPSRTHIRRRFTVWCAAIVLSRRGRTDLLREVVDPVVELLRPLAPQLAPADHEDVLLRHVLLVPAQRHRRTSSSSSSSS